MKFKKFLTEETTSADIATVEGRVKSGKKCREHKRVNCQECLDKKFNMSKGMIA